MIPIELDPAEGRGRREGHSISMAKLKLTKRNERILQFGSRNLSKDSLFCFVWRNEELQVDRFVI